MSDTLLLPETTQTKDIKIPCHICGVEITDSQSNIFNNYKGHDSVYICDDCAEEHTNCIKCLETTHKDDGEIINGDFVCQSCINDWYRTCQDCGEWIDTDNNNYHNYGDDILCDACYNDNYETCSSCDGVIHRDNAHFCDHCERSFCDDCGCDCDEHDGENYYSSRNYTDTLKARNNHEKGEVITSDRLVGCEIETEIEGETYINDCMPACVGLTGDGSLDDGVEIITPPLRGATLENLIKEVCQGCKDANLKAHTTCGLHIHLDASDFKSSDIKIKHLLQTYFLTEKVLYNMLPASRQRGTYCKPLSNRFTLKDIQSRDDADIMWYIDKAEKESITVYNPATGDYVKPNKKQLKQQVSNKVKDRKRYKMDSTRYHGLNIHGIFYRGAVELRYHSGTTNPEKIINWIKINQAMVDYAVKDFKYKKLMEIYQATDSNRIDKFCEVFGLDNAIKKYIKMRTAEFNKDAYANDDESEVK